MMEDCDTAVNADTESLMSNQMWIKLADILKSVDEFLKLSEKWEQSKKFADSHPLVAVFILMLASLSLVPVVCFCLFAFFTTIVLLASGLFLEALLLSVGVVILLGLVTFLGFIALSVTCFAAFAYYGFMFAQQLLRNIQTNIAGRGGVSAKTRQRSD